MYHQATEKWIREAKRAAIGRGRKTLEGPALWAGLVRTAGEGDIQAALSRVLPGGVAAVEPLIFEWVRAADGVSPEAAAKCVLPLAGDVAPVVSAVYATDPSLAPVPLLTELRAKLYPTPAVPVAPPQTAARLEAVRAAGDVFAAKLTERAAEHAAAVAPLREIYERHRMRAPHGVRGVFTLAGPAGAGKSALAEALAFALQAADEEPLPKLAVDLTRYAYPWHADVLFGEAAKPVSNLEGQLGAFVKDHPRCVLLLENLERTSTDVHAALLALLRARDAAWNGVWLVVSVETDGLPGAGAAQALNAPRRNDERPPVPALGRRLEDEGAVNLPTPPFAVRLELVRRTLWAQSNAGFPRLACDEAAAALLLLSLVPRLSLGEIARQTQRWAGDTLRAAFAAFQAEVAVETEPLEVAIVAGATGHALLAEDADPAALFAARVRAHRGLALTPRFARDGARLTVTLEAAEKPAQVPTEGGVTAAGVPVERFDDVVGLDRAKRRLAQVAAWLKHPERLAALGAVPPRGYLLDGPPGTGKTLLARALAGEAGVPFFALSAGELYSKWVGESEERIRKLFAQARAVAPAIIFIDEIDAVGRARRDDSRAYEASILNQLLASMDGFATGEAPVFVLAATNRAGLLDAALRRPGRFDEVIPIDRPAAAARRAFFGRRLPAALAPALDALVAATSGLTPAELDRIVREAQYAVDTAGRAALTGADLEAARRLVVFGAVREDLVARPEDRRNTAYHEAAHAVVQLALLPDQAIDHVSIVPHEDGALGFVASLYDERLTDLTYADVKARLAVLLAGRAGELVLAGGDRRRVTTGAASDLARATQLATQAVAEWGFDDEVGPMVVDAAAPDVRARVRAWLDEARATAEECLGKHREALDRLAERLLVDEVLDGAAVREVARLGRAH